jgi:ABC-type lipoprotein release transport system permease subunit
MAVGTAALVIILSVYNGFDSLVKDTLGNIEPDILVTPAEGKSFVPDGKVLDNLRDHPGITGVCCVIQENVFIDYEEHQGIAKAKGVEASYEGNTPLSSHMVQGTFSLHKGDLPQMVVGSGLAYKLGINTGFLSPARVCYPVRDRKFSMANPMASLQSVKVRPSGGFSVNQQIDDEMVILPIEQMRELLGYDDEITGVEIRIEDGRQTKAMVKEVEALFGAGFKVADRFRQNPSLYKMMIYEKAAIYAILIFIIIIIAFNIFGSLTMLIIEKQDDIATFRSMGGTQGLIRRIFTLEGWMISLLGLSAGLVIGIGFALLQQRFGFIKMPGSFLVSSYPVILQWSDIVATAAGVALIGYLIALIPVRKNIS